MESLEEERKLLQPLCGRPAYSYVPEVMRRVGGDGYVCYASNIYPVPWRAAGQEVLVCEVGGGTIVRRGKESIAVHQLCLGRHQVIRDTVGYHRGMPYTPDRIPTSDKIHIVAGAPEVEVRSLSAYEAVCAGGLNDDGDNADTRGAGSPAADIGAGGCGAASGARGQGREQLCGLPARIDKARNFCKEKPIAGCQNATCPPAIPKDV